MPYIALVLACISGAAGQILLKLGAVDANGYIGLVNLRVVLGLMLYAFSSLAWIFALSKVSLHIAYAFTALTFVMVYIASVVVLGEHLERFAVIGVGLIVVGFFFIVLSTSYPK